MESSWTKVRQLVANRVLTRHLQDLEDQQVAAERHHRQQKRRVERELHGITTTTPRSNRAGSMQIDSATAEPLFPSRTSKRHSLPVLPTTPTNDTPPPPPPTARHRSPPGVSKPGINSLSLGFRPETLTSRHHHDDDDTSDLLDLMASTLDSARSMEQQRPVLYLSGTAADRSQPSESSVHASTSKDRPLAASLKHQRAKAAAIVADPPTPLQLERGERSQVLSFETDSFQVESPLQEEPTKKRADKTNRNRPQKGERDHSETGVQANVDDVASGPRKGNVKVHFYDDKTGLKKEDGGFTPKELSLNMLGVEEEEEEEENESSDAEDVTGGEEEEEIEPGEDEVGLGGEQDPWSELKKCHYIRGYDPPHMRMPKDSVKFVFGDSGHS